MVRSKKSTRIHLSPSSGSHASISVLSNRHHVSPEWLARRAVVELRPIFGRRGARLGVVNPYCQGQMQK